MLVKGRHVCLLEGRVNLIINWRAELTLPLKSELILLTGTNVTFANVQVQLPWWQCNCMDVYVAAVASVLAVVAFIWKIMTMLLSLRQGGSTKRMKMD